MKNHAPDFFHISFSSEHILHIQTVSLPEDPPPVRLLSPLAEMKEAEELRPTPTPPGPTTEPPPRLSEPGCLGEKDGQTFIIEIFLLIS